jgi:integrase
MATHIVLRNRVWHYYRRVPDEVRPFVELRWWRESLKTGDKREAEARARAIAVQHDQIIADVRGRTPRARFDDLSQRATRLRLKVLDALIAQHAAGFAAMDRGVSLDGAARDAHRAAFRTAAVQHGSMKQFASAEQRTVERDMITNAQARVSGLPPEEQDAVVSAGGVQALHRSAVRERIMLETAQTMKAAVPTKSGADAMTRDIELEIRARQLASRTGLLARLGIEDLGAPDDPNNPRINTAMEQWFAKRKQGEIAVKRHRVSIRRFTELHGNVRMRDITRQVVREYLDAIEKLPDHRRIPTHQRGGLADPGADVPRIAAPTVDRHLVSIKALLTFALEQDWVTTNVATGLRAPRDTRPKASRRRAFTLEERKKFLATVVAEDGPDSDRAWFVRLTAYTGARLEEIAQLGRKNIKSVDGIWVVEIDDLEGRQIKEEPRLVPIHHAILDDFLAWHQKGTGDQLFESFRLKGGRFGKKLSGDMARLMDRAGLTDTRLTFHSLRHTLRQQMIKAGIDDAVRREIMGHAARDAHEGYAAADLETIAREFAKLPELF